MGMIDGTRRGMLLALALGVVALHMLVPRARLPVLRELVNLVHQCGHAGATLATGGTVQGIRLETSGAAQVPRRGGAPIPVFLSGYLATALFGALVLWLGKQRWTRSWVLCLTALFVLVVAVRMGDNWFTILFGIVVGLVIGAVGFVLWTPLQMPMVSFLGLWIAFDAVEPLRHLAVAAGHLPGGTSPHARIDPETLHTLTGVPPVALAIGWAALAVLLVGWAISRAEKAASPPRRKDEPPPDRGREP